MSEHAFNPDGLALSADYARTMNEAVLPRIAACRRDETIAGDGGKPLFTSRFDAEAPAGADRPVGTVVIVHGFTENTEKYAEIIHSLLRCGWSVLAYDQRGHGRSWRKPGVTDLSLTHVDRFEDYAEDMRVIADRLLMSMPAPRMLFCHSMGGAVSAMYLENDPCPFERAVFSSPMIAPNVGGFPVGAVRILRQRQGTLRMVRVASLRGPRIPEQRAQLRLGPGIRKRHQKTAGPRNARKDPHPRPRIRRGAGGQRRSRGPGSLRTPP